MLTGITNLAGHRVKHKSYFCDMRTKNTFEKHSKRMRSSCLERRMFPSLHRNWVCPFLYIVGERVPEGKISFPGHGVRSLSEDSKIAEPKNNPGEVETERDIVKALSIIPREIVDLSLYEGIQLETMGDRDDV